MADYGILFLSKLFFYREDSDGNYITPVRHAENSVTFAHPDTVFGYLEEYEELAGALDGTGYDTTLWYHFLL